MTNEQLAHALTQLADLLEFQGANPFRLRTYRQGAEQLLELPQELSEIEAPAVEQLVGCGLGKSVAEKCRELLSTGRLEQLEQILAEVPASVLQLLKVPKLGPKKAAQLFNELGIATVEQLQKACLDGRIQAVKGFGAKTEQTLLAGTNLILSTRGLELWARAEDMALAIEARLAPVVPAEHREWVGDFRRCVEAIDELVLLIEDSLLPNALDSLRDCAEFAAEEPIGKGAWRIRFHQWLPLRLVPVNPERRVAGQLFFTGSAQHLEELQKWASDQGQVLDISEFDTFAGTVLLKGVGSEADCYRRLGLKWIPAELREGRREIAWASNPDSPRLIEIEDIRGDLHMHTTATDGSATIEEMVQAARESGLQYIAITDHSQRTAMANGLTAERLLAQWREIDRLNALCEDDFRILKGIECDILENGQMDLPDSVLAEADWVLASIHYGQQQSREQITDRLLRAIRHPYVSAISHPTGRLINRRPPYEVDLPAVVQAAVEYGKLLELNASPKRLDLNDIHLATARDAGAKFTINTDAHSPRGLAAMRYGINQARRGGLSPEDVVNTLSLDEFLKRRSAGH